MAGVPAGCRPTTAGSPRGRHVRGSAAGVDRGGRLAVALLISTAFAACDRTAVPLSGVVVDTLEAGRIVVMHPDPRRAGALRLVEEIRIGAAEGAGPDVVGNVGTLAVGANGAIYAGDYITGAVKAFASDGEVHSDVGSPRSGTKLSPALRVPVQPPLGGSEPTLGWCDAITAVG